MGIYVSRQRYYYSDGAPIVEVELNGLDYAGADMLVWKYPGEAQEYADPREAINAAIAIRDAWRKDGAPGAEIGIGTTGGMGMELEPSEKTDDELRAWAQERWDALPKCDHCGELRDETNYNYVVDDPEFGKFCSESCTETAWDKYQQTTCQQCGADVPDGRKYFCSDECEEESEENDD